MYKIYISLLNKYIIQEPEEIKAIEDAETIFICSESGVYFFNQQFKESMGQEGLQYASPRIFKNTSTASITGYFCKKSKEPITTLTMTSAVFGLLEAYQYVKSTKKNAVVVLFEHIAKTNKHDISVILLSTEKTETKITVTYDEKYNTISAGQFSEKLKRGFKKDYSISIKDKLDNVISLELEKDL